LGTATNNITTLFSNATTQATSLNSINANIGEYYNYANTTMLTSVRDIGNMISNSSAYWQYANANIGSIKNSVTTLQSQVNGPVFMATQTTGQALSTVGSFVTNLGLVFNSIERASPSGLYNTSTGIFTPNVAGYYQVTVECSIGTANVNAILTNVYYLTTLYKNSNAISGGQTISPISLPGGSYINTASRTSCLVYLNGSTDYVRANLTYYVGSIGSGWNTNTVNTLIPNYFQAIWIRS
jgi:hypothetical protein